MPFESRLNLPMVSVARSEAACGEKLDPELICQELSRISFVRLGFHATAVTDLHLNPFKGTALRGLLGHPLRRLLRAQGVSPEVADHVFGDLWGHGVGKAPGRERGPEKSRPYVIVPPASAQRFFARGEPLRFGVVLVGTATDHSRPIIDAFERAGRESGLSGASGARSADGTPPRNRFGLDFVEATERGGRRRIVWSRDQLHAGALPRLRLVDVTQLPVGVREIEIEFVTPTNLRSNHRNYDRADLRRLIEQILTRVRALARDHCAADLSPALLALVDQAADVQLLADRTRWVSFRRSSSRQGEFVNVGGIVGSATWAGDLDPLIPVLELGRIFGVGKTAVSGCGRYELRYSPAVGGRCAGAGLEV